MIKEIYIRTADDPNFQPNIFEHSNEIEMLLGKLRLMFNTRQGDVLGDLGFGVNLEDELFTFDVSEEELRNKINSQMEMYIKEVKNFDVKFDIQRFRGTARDIILIDIIIDSRKYLGFLVK